MQFAQDDSMVYQSHDLNPSLSDSKTHAHFTPGDLVASSASLLVLFFPKIPKTLDMNLSTSHPFPTFHHFAVGKIKA